MSGEIPYGYCHCGCGRKTLIVKKSDSKRGVKKGEPARFIAGHKRSGFERKPFAERFWSKVAVTCNPDSCWEWLAHKDYKGYGKFKINHPGDKKAYAHRVSYELTHGEIPEGLLVCHRCDNPGCCNPKHLFLGTHQENMEDMVQKDRTKKGEGRHNHKLTEAQVRSIRKQYASGNITHKDLAEQYLVSDSAIRAIVLFKRWKWVK